MHDKEIMAIVYYLLYFGIGLYLIKPKPFNYDVLTLKLRLFPNFFKWIGITVCVITIFTGIIFWNEYEFAKELTFFNFNLGLILISFSKEHLEDEFSYQLRLKSFIISIIITISTFGALFQFFVFYTFKANLWLSKVSAPFIISIFLLTHLFYFYYSKFRLRKE